MNTDLNEAFEAGCESAYEAAYGNMVEAWGEKVANVVMDKLKSGWEGVKKYHKGIGEDFKAGVQSKHRTDPLGAKVEKGVSEVGYKARAKNLGKAALKSTPHAAVAGAAGYGGYRAMNGDKKKR